HLRSAATPLNTSLLLAALLLRTALSAATLLLARASLLLGYLRTRAARFREADCDRLLAARNLLAGAAALQRAAFALAHRSFDFLRGLFAITCHGGVPPRRVSPTTQRALVRTCSTRQQCF